MTEKTQSPYHFDPDIIRESIEGDDAAKRIFCEKLVQTAHAFTHGDCNAHYAGLNLDRENIISNVIFKAWNNLGNFHGESKYTTYLSTIVRNEIRNEIRRRQCRPEGHLKEDPPPRQSDGDNDSASSILDIVVGEDGNRTIDSKSAANFIYRKVEEIENEKHKECVSLWIKGYSYSEMSEKIGITMDGVGSIIHRFKKGMRTCLNEI